MQYLSRASGFAKEAAPQLWQNLMRGAGNMAKGLAKKPAIWKGGLAVGAGVAGGAWAHSQLQKQPPLEAGSLVREKRRAEIDTFGSM